jgi:excisionase family DNA binding protein
MQQQQMAYSPDEFAKLAGVGRDSVYKAIREGKLEARKFGRRTLITSEAGRRFLESLPPLKLRSAA